MLTLTLGLLGGLSAAAPARDWKIYNNTEAVTMCNAGKPTGYSNASCYHVGISTSAAGCATLASALPNISVWTWHDAKQGGFANHCIGRTDDEWRPTGGAIAIGHTSGCDPAMVGPACGRPRPPPAPPPQKVPVEFECGMRAAAYDFAKHLMPSRGAFVEVFDAMQLETMCNRTRPADTSLQASRAGWAVDVASAEAEAAAAAAGSEGTAVHVDGSSGSDTNPGTAAKPVATIEKGVAACRSQLPCSVMISAGTKGTTYYLKDTLTLTPSDSGISLIGVPSTAGAMPTLSGGELLTGLTWSPAASASDSSGSSSGFPAGVMKAKLPAGTAGFDQLFVDQERAVRARHPNALPGGAYRTGRYSTPSTGYFPSAKGWVRSVNKTAERTILEPMVRKTIRYHDFMLGYGGPGTHLLIY
jgi:hypothetical protein